MDMRGQEIFSAHWTEDIDDEFLRNMQHVFGISEKKSLARLNAMKRRCPEWNVPMSSLDFKNVPDEVDPKDRHVAAAALALRASADEDREAAEPRSSCDVYLVTDNIKDMAKKQMSALGVKVITSGAFLSRVHRSEPGKSEQALLQAVSDLKHPPYTREELLGALQVPGARTMVAQLAKKWYVTPVKKVVAKRRARASGSR